MFDPTYGRYQNLPLKKSSPYRRFVQEDKQLQVSPVNSADLGIPAHGTYGALLFHPSWKAKRAQILTRDQHSCTICNANEQLQVHHRQYHFVVKDNKFQPPWEYPDHLLVTLCESCHGRGHGKYKVPTINI